MEPLSKCPLQNPNHRRRTEDEAAVDRAVLALMADPAVVLGEVLLGVVAGGLMAATAVRIMKPTRTTMVVTAVGMTMVQTATMMIITVAAGMVTNAPLHREGVVPEEVAVGHHVVAPCVEVGTLLEVVSEVEEVDREGAHLAVGEEDL